MKTICIIEVEHSKPIPHLAEMIAGRAWSMDGVTRAEVVKQNLTPDQLHSEGFTLAEISLGQGEVHRT
jgi:hypothetical protein